MYEWLNLELLDYKDEEDIWDLVKLFENNSLCSYSELPPKCPFVFLIQKYQEVNGNRSHQPIGFIFLETKNIASNDLYLHFGITKNERGKGYMKQALYILNHKLIGNTMEQDEQLKDYEEILTRSNVIATKSDNEIVNHLLINNSYHMDYQNNYYLGFKKEEKQKKKILAN